MAADRPTDSGGESRRSAEIWSELSSDAELITAARAGDSAAFGTLYERHAPAARAVARQYTRSSADAEDIVSDGFIKVFAVVRAGGGPDIAFRAYLFTVVRRLAYAGAQGGRRVQPTDDMAIFETAFGAAGSPEDPALAGFERGVVAKAYASLPERWQAALWYTEIEQLSAAQIAPLLGLTANGVAALAYRAREGLRQAYLQQHLAEPQSDQCRTVNHKFGAYVRGGLAKRETAQVEAHLDSCGECRSLVLELGDVNHGLRIVIAPLILGVLGLGALASPLPIGGLVGIGAGLMAGSGGAAAGAGVGTGVGAGVTAGSAGGAAVGSATGAAATGAAASGTAAGATAGTAAATAGSTAGTAAAAATAGTAATAATAGTAAAGTAAGALGSAVAGTAAAATAGTAATVGAAAGTAAAGAAAASAGTAVVAGSVAGTAAVAAGAMAGTAVVAVGTAGAAAATGGVAALVASIPMSVVGAVAAGLVAGSLAIAGVNGLGDASIGGAGQVLAGPTASPSASTTDALADELLAAGGVDGLPGSTLPGPADVPAELVLPVDVPPGSATIVPEELATTGPAVLGTPPETTPPETTPPATTPPETTPPSNPSPPPGPTPTPTPEPPPLTPADLRVVGQVGAGVLAAGSDGLVSFTIENTGQATAGDLRAELALPAGITYSGSSASDSWACGSPAGSSTVVCTLSGMASLSSGSITIGVRVAEEFAAAEADLGLSVTAGAVQAGTVVHTSVQPAPARLALGQSSDASLVVGTAAFITVPIRNAGGVRTGALRVSVRMPAGIHATGTGLGAWTCLAGDDPRDLVCTTGAVGPRTAVPLALALRADDDALGQPSVLALVATQDGSAVTVRSEVRLTVAPVPVELAVSLPGRVTTVAGGSTRVQITVANVGAGPAAHVVVALTAPPGVSVRSAGCTGGPADLTCTVGAVPVGGTGVLAFDVLADGSAVGDLATGVTLTVTAPDTAPLVSQVPITVTAPRLAFTAGSLLRVVLNPDDEGEHHHGTVTFAVSNTGSADARGVAATVLLPAGLWVVSDGATSCTRVAGGVVCNLGDLAPGATAHVALEVHVDGAPELAARISVRAERLGPIALTAP